jgi:iron complex outermembrane receptor protein
MRSKIYALVMILFISVGAMAQSYTVSGTVTDDQSQPLPGVSVVIKGTSNGTSSDFDGKYSLAVSNGDVLVFSFVGFNTQEILADGSTTLDVMMQAGVTLDEVVLVGTRGEARLAMDSPVPVDVLDVKELTSSSPQVNLNQILNYVAPSFTSNTQTISDGTDHIDPASLRGLGPDQVLVLINGKRRHTSSLINVNGTFGRGNVGTDLNAIPAAAIRNIEVLRDGAAAQYGSDAIAGVININLKENTGELSVNVTSGANFTENANYLKGGVDGATVNTSVNYGISLGEKGGFINFTGDFDTRDYYSRMGTYTGQIFHGWNAIEWKAYEAGTNVDDISLAQAQFFANELANDGVFTSQLASAINGTSSLQGIADLLTNPTTGAPIDFTEAVLSQRDLTREDFLMRVGQSALRGGRFFANMALPLGDSGAKVYANMGMSLRKGNAAGFYRLPYQSRAYTAQYINGFLPEINSDIKDKSLTAGILGKIGDWDVDFSNTFGTNSFMYNITNSFNASKGLSSKTSYNSGGFSFSQNTTNLDFTNFYEDALAAGLNVAAGLEYRVENYSIVAGEEGSWATYDVNGDVVTNDSQEIPTDFFGRTRPGGVQVFPGFRPENELSQYRNSMAAYLDLEANFTDSFLLTGALRYENYSDFGGTLNYKLASRVKINDNLNFRAAVNTGFRAPSLHQIYFNSTSTLFVDGVPSEVGLFANDSKVAEILGIPKLKQEVSQSLSIGFTGKIPDANLKLSIDGYFVAIEDRVVLTGTFRPTTPELETLFTQAGATKAAFFANAIDTNTKGLDVVLTHQASLGSKWRLKNDFAATFSETKQVDDIHSSQVLVNAGQESTYFDAGARVYLEDAVPGLKMNLANTLSSKKLNFFLRNTYFGEVTEATNNVANQQIYSAKVVTDLSLGYNFSDSFKLSVGANNLFDVYPDKTIAANSSSGRFIYSRRSQQFGTAGRFLFARLGFTLK